MAGARVYLNANGSIPNNQETVLVWDTILRNSSGLTIGADGTFTVPINVSKIRFSGKVVWSGNGNGYRQTEVKKNGSSVAFAIYDRAIPSNDAITVSRISTEIIDVGAGDVLTVRLTQNSGQAVTVQGAGFTYLGVEVF